MSVSLAAVGSANFTGRNGIGSVTVPGLKVGDTAVFVNSSIGPINPGTSFEVTISVADQIQQLNSGDLSAYAFTICFFRAT